MPSHHVLCPWTSRMTGQQPGATNLVILSSWTLGLDAGGAEVPAWRLASVAAFVPQMGRLPTFASPLPEPRGRS